MNEKELLTKQMIMVTTNEVRISTEDKPIIGTEGLVSCIGFILYNEYHKKAIVGHITPDTLMNDKKLLDLQSEIFGYVTENQLFDSPFELNIIEGLEKSRYQKYAGELEILEDYNKFRYTLVEVLEEGIKRVEGVNIISINKLNFPDNAIKIDENTKSSEFAFDSSTGKFVTDKVLFGKEYFEVNEDERTR